MVKVGGAGHRRSSFSEFVVQYQYLLFSSCWYNCSCYNGKPNTPSIVTSNQHPYLGGELHFFTLPSSRPRKLVLLEQVHARHAPPIMLHFVRSAAASLLRIPTVFSTRNGKMGLQAGPEHSHCAGGPRGATSDARGKIGTEPRRGSQHRGSHSCLECCNSYMLHHGACGLCRSHTKNLLRNGERQSTDQ